MTLLKLVKLYVLIEEGITLTDEEARQEVKAGQDVFGDRLEYVMREYLGDRVNQIEWKGKV